MEIQYFTIIKKKDGHPISLEVSLLDSKLGVLDSVPGQIWHFHCYAQALHLHRHYKKNVTNHIGLFKYSNDDFLERFLLRLFTVFRKLK